MGKGHKKHSMRKIGWEKYDICWTFLILKGWKRRCWRFSFFPEIELQPICNHVVGFVMFRSSSLRYNGNCWHAAETDFLSKLYCSGRGFCLRLYSEQPWPCWAYSIDAAVHSESSVHLSQDRCSLFTLTLHHMFSGLGLLNTFDSKEGKGSFVLGKITVLKPVPAMTQTAGFPDSVNGVPLHSSDN